MENKAILAERGHLIKGFDSQMAECRLKVAGTGELFKVSKQVGNFWSVLVNEDSSSINMQDA